MSNLLSLPDEVLILILLRLKLCSSDLSTLPLVCIQFNKIMAVNRLAIARRFVHRQILVYSRLVSLDGMTPACLLKLKNSGGAIQAQLREFFWRNPDHASRYPTIKPPLTFAPFGFSGHILSAEEKAVIDLTDKNSKHLKKGQNIYMGIMLFRAAATLCSIPGKQSKFITT